MSLIASMLFDTHSHLDSPEFSESLPAVIDSAVDHGVTRILTVATDLRSTHASIQIAEQYTSVYAAAGIHPNHCQDATDAHWKEIQSLLTHPRVVALGETGLDKHWDFCPLERQQDFFARHIRLSHETGLPFIVHMRDCEPEMLQALERNTARGQLNGIMHSFCGSAAAAQQCLEWGMMISFAGMLTYPKNTELRRVAATIPADRLLLETDSPWLSPHPHRRVRPNTPAMMRHTLECLAETRREGIDELEHTTTENALRLFGIEQIDNAHSPNRQPGVG